MLFLYESLLNRIKITLGDATHRTIALMLELPKFTLVLGGISSGKSAFAEGLAQSAGRPVTYFATAEAHDAEMETKIADHRKRRAGLGWSTIEAPLDLSALSTTQDVVLLDCLTMWISNHMGADRDLKPLGRNLREIATQSPASIIAVSNEVGLGGIADNPTARHFAKAQGAVNQEIAQFADLVVLVTAGLPLAIKGKLP